MNILLSIDPGLRGCGCALWRDGELQCAEYVRGCKDNAAAFADVVEEMGQEIESWAQHESNFDFLTFIDSWLVIERQRVYGGRAARGDASDLIDVAVVVGAIVGRLGVPTRIIHSQDWKGTIKKPRTKAEYRRDGYVVENRTQRDLSPEELARIELVKNWDDNLDVWDATGIGLWALRATGARAWEKSGSRSQS
jgi:hypothetical protein